MKKLILSFLLLLVALAVMPGCNTISGIGRDVSNVGSSVTSGANAVGQKMSNH